MRLSLIVTTFKRPELLARALRSVAEQVDATLQIELIVSDDDPEASGREGVQASGIADVRGIRLQVLCREGGPGGVAAARNRAIAASGGDWLMFLDDDDTLRAGALRALLDRARNGDADLVCGRHVYAHEQAGAGVLREVESRHHWTDLDGLLVRNVLPMGAFILRRDAVRVPFNTAMRTHEDWLFLLDNLVAASPHPRVAAIDQVVLSVHQAVDGSRRHRNDASRLRQQAADFVRIYAMHPAPHLREQRRRRLASLSTVDLDTLISGSVEDPGPIVAPIPFGRFLVEAGKTRLFEGLPDFGQAVTEATALALVGLKLRPGPVVEVGAGRGPLTIPLARLYPHCEVLGVEADPRSFMYLCANVLASMLGNVEPRRARIGAVVAAQTAYSACPELTLDRLWGPDRPPVVLVRIGTRSALPAVLEGATGMLREHRPVLLLPRADEALGPTERGLMRQGYQLVTFQHNLVALHAGEPSSPALLAAYRAGMRAGPGNGAEPTGD